MANNDIAATESENDAYKSNEKDLKQKEKDEQLEKEKNTQKINDLEKGKESIKDKQVTQQANNQLAAHSHSASEKEDVDHGKSSTLNQGTQQPQRPKATSSKNQGSKINVEDNGSAQADHESADSKKPNSVQKDSAIPVVDVIKEGM